MQTTASPRHVQALVAVVALVVAATCMTLVYPWLERWGSDDYQYLSVAQQLVHGYGPVKNYATEVYGGDVHNTGAIPSSIPILDRILGYHFPVHSSLLAATLWLTSDMSWAVALLQTALFVMLALFVLGIASAQGWGRRDTVLVTLAGVGSPVMIMYLPSAMQEILVVTLAVAACRRLFFEERPAALLDGGLWLTLLVLCRFSFLPLVVLACVFQLVVVRHPRRLLTAFALGVVPLVAYFTVGQRGWFWLLGRSSTSLSEAPANFLLNLERLATFRPSLTGLGFGESWVWLGVVASLVVVGRRRWRDPWTWVCGYYLMNVAGALIFYDWRQWRQVRVLMWFLPLLPVLVAHLVGWLATHFRPGKSAFSTLSVVATVAVFGGCSLWQYNETVRHKWPAETHETGQRYARYSALKAMLDRDAPKSRYIVTDHEIGYAAILDPHRRYYTPGKKTTPEVIAASIRKLQADTAPPDVYVLASPTALGLSLSATPTTLKLDRTPTLYIFQAADLSTAMVSNGMSTPALVSVSKTSSRNANRAGMWARSSAIHARSCSATL